MLPTVRALIFGIAVLVFVGGLIGAVAGEVAGGLWAMVIGAVGMLAVVFERQRYRSQTAEHGPPVTGPGGGEPDPPAPPFRPTEERFVDPTSGRWMRVYVDPGSGERRYHAER